MAHTIEEFSQTARKILLAEPNPAGRNKLAALLTEYLQDSKFVDATLKTTTPERKILFEDETLGFCVLAHQYKGAKKSAPHDHGPYWAIYGQASGDTEMSDFAKVAAPDQDKPGKARKIRTYTLKPGMAHVYNEFDLHAPTRTSSTKLIRIEGKNMETVKRDKYEEVP